MSKYKTAIAVKCGDKELCIVPYVKTTCGDTENIGFITSTGEPRTGKVCDEMSEVMNMIEELIIDSIMED